MAGLTTPADASTPQLPGPNGARAPFAVAISCAIVGTLAISLRILSRRVKKVKLAAEDYTIFLALFAVYVMSVGVLLQPLIGGAGHHVDTVFPGRVTNLLKVLVVLQVFFGISLGLVKISICLFYVRIFETNAFKLMATAVIIFSSAWIVMCILIAFLICQPLARSWDSTITKGSCGNERAAWIAIGATDIVADVCVMMLPIPMLVKLQMPWATKLGLSLIFSLGIFTMTISGIRISSLVHTSLDDVTYTASNAFCWSVIEPTAGLIIACAPMYRSLFGSIFGSIQSARSRQYGSRPRSTTHAFNRLPDEIALVELGANTQSQSKASAAALGTQSNAKSGNMSFSTEIEAPQPAR